MPVVATEDGKAEPFSVRLKLADTLVDDVCEPLQVGDALRLSNSEAALGMLGNGDALLLLEG